MTRLAFTYNGGLRENETIEQIRASGRFLPALSLVAEVEGQVVGHVIVAPTDPRGDLTRPGRPRRVLLLGPISVLPGVQRRGSGSALTPAVLERVRACAEPMVVLRCGATPTTTHASGSAGQWTSACGRTPRRRWSPPCMAPWAPTPDLSCPPEGAPLRRRAPKACLYARDLTPSGTFYSEVLGLTPYGQV
ncbi:GNAT family N-acetyltransferase [Deinococcus hopiensis]|uniref:N-acetyltransferase domain-containing protein n=1 Tax=Deinococcus hopiensis KR-140 TaxID=695939 RepID=A0A1W1VAI6_9DEIO|nr:N-acetyltransferase [Deinococcus hopiensis]SMB90223.1 hypothetical protein SAMN00790413_00688 [Deinococcus hopiensis KR-140]